MRDLGAGWSPRGIVYMTHQRVNVLWHLLIQLHVALQVVAYRQRLEEGNT